MQFCPTMGFHPFVRSNGDLAVRQNRRGFWRGLGRPKDCLSPWGPTLDHKARPNLGPDKRYNANLWSQRIARVRGLQTPIAAPVVIFNQGFFAGALLALGDG